MIRPKNRSMGQSAPSTWKYKIQMTNFACIQVIHVAKKESSKKVFLSTLDKLFCCVDWTAQTVGEIKSMMILNPSERSTESWSHLLTCYFKLNLHFFQIRVTIATTIITQKQTCVQRILACTRRRRGKAFWVMCSTMILISPLKKVNVSWKPPPRMLVLSNWWVYLLFGLQFSSTNSDSLPIVFDFCALFLVRLGKQTWKLKVPTNEKLRQWLFNLSSRFQNSELLK